MTTGRPDAQRLPDNLELVRPLGHGGMAEVCLARDRTLKRLVAVKTLLPEIAADPTSRMRFEREAQAAARLSHASVTTVYSVGRLDDDEPYIEMEYIDGDNLADILKARGHFAIDEVRAILIQLSSALAAAHSENIVHRDVKPANVLVEDRTRRACLTDFGVAAILETGNEAVTRLTRENERFGDPRYRSPEQLRGEPLTGQSDVYSLGIIGYELLTGQGPFDSAEIRDMASAHLRRPPPDLTLMRPDVPSAMADLLHRCLSKRPEHRPRAHDVAEQLQHPTADASLNDTDPTGPVMSFLRELKQRRVYQTAVAYAAATFIVLQVADLLLPALPDSDMLYRYTVIVCLAGFPLAVVLAWIFDIRQGRLVRADEGVLAKGSSPTQRTLLKVIGLAISVGLATAIAAWLLPV